MLFKLLRKFREKNKNNLEKFSSQNSLDSQNYSMNKGEECTVRSKRKRKREKKERKSGEQEYEDNHNKFHAKYSNPQDKGLMPDNYKDLFTNLMMSEEDDNTPPNGIKIKNNLNKFQNKFMNKNNEIVSNFEVVNEFLDD